jgi:hypothetical protein
MQALQIINIKEVNMKRWKKILLIICTLGLIGGGYGWYLYNKKPADVRTLKADFSMNAKDLLDAYNKDETAANAKYADKTIEVSGKIAEIKVEDSTCNVTLDTGDPLAAISCSFYNEEAATVKKAQVGQEVSIKGMCTGKLSDVVLNKCSITKP